MSWIFNFTFSIMRLCRNHSKKRTSIWKRISRGTWNLLQQNVSHKGLSIVSHTALSIVYACHFTIVTYMIMSHFFIKTYLKPDILKIFYYIELYIQLHNFFCPNILMPNIKCNSKLIILCYPVLHILSNCANLCLNKHYILMKI